VQMVMAERDYQANVSVITQARQAYESALGLGT
jgi:flagellar basal body rod protein FlgC